MKGLVGEPVHRRLQAGLFQIMHTHITRIEHEDTWPPAYSICMHRRMYSVQCSDKIHFPQLCIKCKRGQVLPGYPHSSAGAYGPVKESITQLTMYCIIHLHKFQLTIYKYKIKLHSSGRKSVLVFVGNCRPSFYIRQTMLKRI